MDAEPQGDSENKSSVLRVLLVAPVVTVALAIFSLICTMSFIPRRTEGIREVPDVSWGTYALIGNVIPIVFSLLILGFVFRSSRHRVLAWVIAAAFCYIAHATFLTTLLRRDFIGKC